MYVHNYKLLSAKCCYKIVLPSIQGLAVVCEPLLGFTLIGLTVDCECLTMPLPR